MISATEQTRRGLEQDPETARYMLMAREHVRRTLVQTGYFHGDDLGCLGIPERYSRSIHGSVVGYYSGKGFMDAISLRKSERPSRKGSKTPVYRITEKGRLEFGGAGLGIENSEEDNPAATGPLDRLGGLPVPPHGAESSRDAEPGDGSVESVPSSASTEPPRLFDSAAAKERPRSAITDPRAA